MIVQSLVRYYDVLAADKNVKITPPGYSPADISFTLVISKDGKLTNILDHRDDLKVIDVPFQKSRAVSVIPYFVCDNAKYIFGIEKISTNPKKKTAAEVLTILEESDNEKIVVTKRSAECFKRCRDLHHTLMDKLDDPYVRAFLKFLDGWKPESTLQHSKFLEYKDDILAGGFFVFDIDGKYLHQNPVIRQIWESHYSLLTNKKSHEGFQCLVSGNIEPIARTHQKIKRVYGAQPAGANLISFNDSAFWSYGKNEKKTEYNAPISEVAMFKYTTVLNYLLERGSKNRIQIGDTSTVFWAETDKKTCESLALFFIDPVDEPEEAGPEETDGEIKKQDHSTRQLVSDILLKVKSGGHLEEKDLGVDPDKTNFFILGLSPNNARLAVRYWHQDNFGNFIIRLARHHLDMEIDRDDRGPQYISMYRLLRETVPQSSTDKAASPLLGGLLMRSILDGTPYPVPMYNAIVNRVKVERSINYARAGFIKACLIRMARARGENEEEITVSLNEENKDVPYRLGRLFAVLEKAQSDSNKDVKIKSTINSKYFSSASTTPQVVFPVLIKLAQHHIAKSDWGIKSNQMIADILYDVDKWPTSLNLEEQGMFMLGYYHQRKANYRKKSSNEEKNEGENITEAAV